MDNRINKKKRVDKDSRGARKKLRLNNTLNDERQSLKKKINELEKEELQLDEEIAKLLGRGVSTDLSLEMNALHEYNNMKDMAQVVIGYLANFECMTVRDLHNRYNLPVDD